GMVFAQEAAQVSSNGGVTSYSVPAQSGRAAQLDFVHAKPMPLPVNLLPGDTRRAQIQALLSSPSFGTPGVSPGSVGSGATSPEFVGVPAASAGQITPQEYGTNNHPFDTARADLNSGGATPTNTTFPYRAAGKLFFNIGSDTYICSASLIKRGVVVTAGHCAAN